MAAPTLISLTESSNYRATNANKNTPSISWLAGDCILVWGQTGDNGDTLTSPAASALTFTNQITSNTSGRTKLYLWTAIAAADGSSIFTGTMNAANPGGYVVKVWRDVTALGAVNSATGTAGASGAPTGTLVVAQASSVVDGAWGDWNAVTGARTYRTTNLGAATEDDYYTSGTFATTAFWSNAGTSGAGTFSVGVTAPTATAWMLGAIELQGSVGVPGAGTGYGDGAYGDGSYGVRGSSTTPKPSTESVFFSEAILLSITEPVADAVAAADAGAVNAQQPVSDPSSHSDATTSLNVTSAPSDAGTVSEAASQADTLALSDAQTHSEATSQAVTETATDGGSVGDTPTLGQTLGVSDAGAVGEAAAESIAQAITEAIAAADAISAAAQLAASDGGIFSDLGQALIPIPASDSATQGDAGAVNAAQAAQESGTFAEAVSAAAQAAASDALVHSESVISGEFADKLVSESVLLSEAAALANAVAVSDSHAIADAISALAVTLAVNDPVAMNAAAALLAAIPALDGVSISEAVSMIQSGGILASDAVTLMESVAQANQVSVSDSWLTGRVNPTYYSSIVAADGPTAYYRMNELSGTTLADVMASYPATISGSPMPQLGAATPIGSDSGGASVRFTGGVTTTLGGPGADVTMPMSGSVPVTLEAWVNFATNEAFGPIIDLSDPTQPASNGRQYALTTASGGLRYYVRSTGGSETPAATTGWNDGNWHHVVGVYNGADRRLYVDGTLRNTQTGAVATAFAASANARLGYDARTSAPNRYPTDIRIDEAAIYINTALSAAQVAAHYNAGLLGIAPGLATVDVLTVKAALDNWALSEVANAIQGIPAPMLRLPLTAAIVARAAVSSVVSQLAVMAVQAREAATEADAPSMSASVDDTLGQTVPTDRSAKTTPVDQSASSDLQYG